MCNNHFCLYFCGFPFKFTITLHETKKNTDFWKVNLNTETGISIFFLNSCPLQNEGLSFISDRYTIKFEEPIYETDIQNDSEINK